MKRFANNEKEENINNVSTEYVVIIAFNEKLIVKSETTDN